MTGRVRTARAAAASVIAGALALAACGTTSESTPAASEADLPGVTESTVTIGVAYPPDTEGEAATTGHTSPADPAMEDAAEALAGAINEDGGLDGRQIELVFHPFDLSGTFSAAFQGACSSFTEDAEVFAATTELVRDDVSILADCLSASGAILAFDQVGAPFRQDEYDEWRPYVYNPGYVYFDRYDAVVGVAADSDLIADGARVGVVHQDLPALGAAVDEVVSAVEEVGAEVVAEAPLPPVASPAEFGQAAQQTRSAVLQFKSENVDQVLFVGTAPTAPQVFMNTAQAQGYNPAYLLTSDLNAQFLVENAPAEQVASVAGVGWNPVTDVGDTTGEEAPGAAACFDTLREAGIDVQTDPNQLLHLCSFFGFLRAAVDQAGSLDAEAIQDAYAELGDGYEPTTTFAVAPEGGRTDGVSEVRPFAYAGDCRCFRYTADAQALG